MSNTVLFPYSYAIPKKVIFRSNFHVIFICALCESQATKIFQMSLIKVLLTLGPAGPSLPGGPFISKNKNERMIT